MKQNSNSLDLATQVLQEQLTLLSDTPDNIEIDLKKSKHILEISKQIVDVEKLKLDQNKVDLEKQQFVYELCKDVSSGSLRHIPKDLSNEVTLLE